MSAISDRASSVQCPLGFGLQFEDLYVREGLLRLDAAFLNQLLHSDLGLHVQLLDARVNPGARSAKQQSELMIALAPHVEDFLGELFGIATEVRALQARHDALGPLFALKRKFIQKKAISGVTQGAGGGDRRPRAGRGAGSVLFGEPLTEQSFVEHVSHWLEDEAEHLRGDCKSPPNMRRGRRLSGGPQETSRRCSVQGAAQAGSAAPGAGGDAEWEWNRQACAARGSLAPSRRVSS